mgnify:CR=1 FL=1|nr:MAG TPA: hypothetical protein [Caudoviricetes sp.]
MKRMLNQNLIDFLNSLGDSLKYESSSNTFEIGTNLYVDGNIEFSGQYIKGGVWLDMGDSGYFYIQTQTDNSDDYIEFHISPGDGTIHGLTDNNTKTLFGNQSIYGSGNIDLYKHYLLIKAKSPSNTTYSCFIAIYSSSNVNCSSSSGATQKLKNLLKISGTSQRYYDTGMTSGAESACILYWSGQVLEVMIDTESCTITSIEDSVETI